MTSSLVGSEMCIRDRRGWVGVWSAPPKHRCCSGALPRFLRMRVRGPVSYTHLTLPTICSV
eukprot:301206-Prorocentrum_lima.AAC.1